MERNISADRKLQRTVSNITRGVTDIPKSRVTVDVQNEYRLITVSTKYTHVPDFRFEWCDAKGHYRVYMLSPNAAGVKEKPKYSTMVIRDSASASGFVVMYEFMIRNRANQKTPVVQ